MFESKVVEKVKTHIISNCKLYVYIVKTQL